jgi:two-component system, chemotaxis family, CheB/CheR fusion protein
MKFGLTRGIGGYDDLRRDRGLGRSQLVGGIVRPVFRQVREDRLAVIVVGRSGLGLLQRLPKVRHRLRAITITGNSGVPMAVQAMKAGASDFIEKPIGRESHSATSPNHGTGPRWPPQQEYRRRLGIGRRTVESHRASIINKIGSKSLPALALAAAWNDADEPLVQRGSPVTTGRIART